MKDLDKVGLIKQSWDIVKKNYKLIALLLATFLIFNLIQSVVSAQLRFSALASIVSLLFTLISLFLEVGFIKIILKIVDGKSAEYKELWSYPQYFINVVLASIVYGIAVIVGLILLVVPGIYLALRLQFYVYLIVDKNLSPMDALKGSWKLTEGNVINLFIFMLILVVLNIIGAILLLVGLLVTIPVSFVAVTLLYRKLSA